MVGRSKHNPPALMRFPKVPLGALLVLGVVGCTSTVQPTSWDDAQYGRAISTTTFKIKDNNYGRIVGTLTFTPEELQWAGVTSLQGAVAQAFDPDGTPLDAKVNIDQDGHFTIEGLLESRPRIFVEADINGLRFRSTLAAPRDHKDYPVVLDPGSTYLADKLRRAALDQNVAFDKLDPDLVDQTTEVVNTYMQDGQRRQVLEQTNPDLNAYSFDHFMDNNEPVKLAVYQLAPAILRGWTPPPDNTQPSVDPNLFPSPFATPSVNMTPIPNPSPTGPLPK